MLASSEASPHNQEKRGPMVSTPGIIIHSIFKGNQHQ